MRHTPNPLARRFSLEFFAQLPRDSGVYFMRSKKGEVLYVGKAKNLRSRLLSYRYARWGTAGDNILALLGHVRSIDWEVCASEDHAVVREREIIRAVVPRYNVADAWEEDYFYVGLRVVPGKDQLSFRLTDRETGHPGYVLHGCFRHRRIVKDAYASLLRLLAAAGATRERYALPPALCRRSPSYEFTLPIPRATHWRALTSAFLRGQHTRLLPALVEALLENPTIPPFARPALQRDLQVLRRFADVCVPETSRLVSQEEMRETIRRSVELPRSA